MSFANHNILDIALSIIPPTIVQVRKNLGMETNKYGQANASYGEWVDVYGIVQPGAEMNEHVEGLDISKKRVTIWLRGFSLKGTHLQWTPDQIRFMDRIYNVTSVDDWFPYDNYRKCECVEALNLGDSQKGMPSPPKKKTTTRKKSVPKKVAEEVEKKDKQETAVVSQMVLPLDNVPAVGKTSEVKSPQMDTPVTSPTVNQDEIKVSILQKEEQTIPSNPPKKKPRIRI